MSPGLAPVVAAQRAAVRACLQDVPRGSLALVACSGGPDSLALAAALAFVAPRDGLRAGAVVVDHGLQPGSADVAAAAATACRAAGLDPVEVRRVDVGAVGGPEAAARDARYAAVDAVAAEHRAAAVLLGHTMDDQAEQVLLGLARGSGARSLAGMPARRGLLRRPFLGVRRAETLAACAALGLQPWHDPTNGPRPGPAGGGTDGPRAGASTGVAPGADGGAWVPLRSRVRHEVLPVVDGVLGPGVVPALFRTSEQLAEDAAALDLWAARVLETAVDAAGGDVAGGAGDRAAQAAAGGDVAGGAGDRAAAVVLDVSTLAAAPVAVRRRALRTALVRAGVPAGSLHRVHVVAVDALVVDWHGQGPVHLPGGRRARRSCGRLAVGPTDDREL